MAASERCMAGGATVIRQLYEEWFGFLEGLSDPLELAQHNQSVSKLEPEIDGVFESGSRSRKLLQDVKRLLEEVRSSGVSVEAVSLGACSLQVVKSHRPEPSLFRMLCHDCHVRIKPARRNRDNATRRARVRFPLQFLREALVGCFARRCMLERILRF